MRVGGPGAPWKGSGVVRRGLDWCDGYGVPGACVGAWVRGCFVCRCVSWIDATPRLIRWRVLCCVRSDPWNAGAVCFPDPFFFLLPGIIFFVFSVK